MAERLNRRRRFGRGRFPRGRARWPVDVVGVIGVIGVIALLVGCGETESTDQRIATAVDDSSVASPLNLLLGVSESGRTGMADSERLAQERLVECMTAAGFRYVPIELSDLEAADPLGAITGTVALEQVEEHGYGIADSLQAALLDRPLGLVDDPNLDIRAGLSEEDRAAYDRALSGVDPSEVIFDEESGRPIDAVSGEPLTPEAFAAASSDGCLYQAYSEIETLTPAAVDLLSSEAYADLQFEINSDPRMIDLVTEWSRCMATKGHRYRSNTQIMDELAAEAENIAHEAESDHHDVTEGQVQIMIDQLRSKELVLAVDDWRCSDDLFEQAPDISREHEVDFLRENEAAIIAILDERSVEAGDG